MLRRWIFPTILSFPLVLAYALLKSQRNKSNIRTSLHITDPFLFFPTFAGASAVAVAAAAAITAVIDVIAIAIAVAIASITTTTTFTSILLLRLLLLLFRYLKVEYCRPPALRNLPSLSLYQMTQRRFLLIGNVHSLSCSLLNSLMASFTFDTVTPPIFFNICSSSNPLHPPAFPCIYLSFIFFKVLLFNVEKYFRWYFSFIE